MWCFLTLIIGVYLFYNNGDTEVEAKIIPASNDIDLSSLPTITSGIYIYYH